MTFGALAARVVLAAGAAGRAGGRSRKARRSCSSTWFSLRCPPESGGSRRSLHAEGGRQSEQHRDNEDVDLLHSVSPLARFDATRRGASGGATDAEGLARREPRFGKDGRVAADAYVNDNRREIWGADAIRAFVQKEFVGDHVTMEVREVVDNYGDVIVRARFSGHL